MAFWGGFAQFAWRSGAAGAADPTLLTAELLATLFPYTRTGEVFGRRSPGGPGNYIRHAANDPELDFSTVAGKSFPSLIVRPGATPYVSHSADLARPDWTKTNCTAALALGGLDHGAEWRGTSMNGTEELKTFAGDLPVVDGDGYIIKRNLTNTVNNYLQIPALSSKPFVYIRLLIEAPADAEGLGISVGIGDNSHTPLLSFTTLGEHEFIYRFDTNVRVTANFGSKQKVTIIEMAEVAAHTVVTATADNATITRTITRSSTLRNTRWKLKPSGSNTGEVKASQDNGSASTTLTPGAFSDVTLGEQTAANPTIWLQMTKSGDAVEHYDVQHVELGAGVPVPNFVPQGATPVAIGAGAATATVAEAPTEFDISILFMFSPRTPGATKTLASPYKDIDNHIHVYQHGDTGAMTLNTRLAAANDTLTLSGGYSSTTPMLLRIKQTGTTVTYWTDGVETEETGHAAIPAAIAHFYLGHRAGTNHFNDPLVAAVDNSGSLLGEAGAGFNVDAIARYEASL